MQYLIQPICGNIWYLCFAKNMSKNIDENTNKI